MTFAYDAVPYRSQPFLTTEPDRLATVGRLLGVDTPLPSTARVLEIGCATGGNLIPMAVLYPEARFVGVDLSPVQIRMAREEAAPFDLPNLDLRQGDLVDIDASWGTFDYIIAHGVWSWVPHEVQERLFAVCAERLSPTGVAYVSHNVFPGWRVRGIVRELMRLHTEGIDDPAGQIAKAREAAKVLATAHGEDPEDPLKAAVHREAAGTYLDDDAYLLHEFLAPDNEPVWFREFAQRASAHGLAFLADARFAESLPMHLPEAAQAWLADVRDIVLLEQYIDFFRNTHFRCTLLVKDDVPVNRAVDWHGALPLHYTCQGELDTGGHPLSSSEAATLHQRDNKLTTDSPVMKAALAILAERWPESLAFDDLLAAARQRYGGHGEPASDRQVLGQLLLLGFANTIVRPRREPSLARKLGPQPEVFAVARHQAARGEDRLTTTRQRPVEVSPEQAAILALLDGTRTRDDIVAAGHDPVEVDSTLARAEHHALFVG